MRAILFWHITIRLPKGSRRCNHYSAPSQPQTSGPQPQPRPTPTRHQDVRPAPEKKKPDCFQPPRYQSIDAFDGSPERRAAAEEERLRQLTLATPVKLKGSEHYTSSKVNRRSRPVVAFSLKLRQLFLLPADRFTHLPDPPLRGPLPVRGCARPPATGVRRDVTVRPGHQLQLSPPLPHPQITHCVTCTGMISGPGGRGGEGRGAGLGRGGFGAAPTMSLKRCRRPRVTRDLELGTKGAGKWEGEFPQI